MKFPFCCEAPPHDTRELSRPEPGLSIAGFKSYGRAPTLVMAARYEQVRSVVPEITGDGVAREERLVLSETDVCNAFLASAASSCCGDLAPASAEASCEDDAFAKEQGNPGCGYSGEPADTAAIAICWGAA